MPKNDFRRLVVIPLGANRCSIYPAKSKAQEPSTVVPWQRHAQFHRRARSVPLRLRSARQCGGITRMVDPAGRPLGVRLEGGHPDDKTSNYPCSFAKARSLNSVSTSAGSDAPSGREPAASGVENLELSWPEFRPGVGCPAGLAWAAAECQREPTVPAVTSTDKALARARPPGEVQCRGRWRGRW